MECISLTSDLRKYFGIISCHVVINEKDIMVMLEQLSDELVVFSCTFLSLCKGMEVLIIFPSLFGRCEVNAKISSIKTDVFFVIECNIINTNKNEFFIQFQNYVINLINQKKRKEERILCNEKNLKRLRLNNIIMLTYKYRNFRAVIKDISYSGIKILTSPLFLQTKDELFSFSIRFNEPEDKFFFVNCPIVRKQTFTFENFNFAEIVFKLGENINYRKRLDSYFYERKNNFKR